MVALTFAVSSLSRSTIRLALSASSAHNAGTRTPACPACWAVLAWNNGWRVRFRRAPLTSWCADFRAARFLIEKLVEPLLAGKVFGQGGRVVMTGVAHSAQFGPNPLMNEGISWSSSAITLLTAAVGALAAFAVARWSFNRAMSQALKEQRLRDIATLDSLCFEIEIALRIASRGSVAEIPTVLLNASSHSLGLLDPGAREVLAHYAEAVHRYNGRTRRLVLYAAAKRARGDDPGAEKISTHHTVPVQKSSTALLDALRKITAR